MTSGTALSPAQNAPTHTKDPRTIGFGSVPELENRPRSDFENAVMSKLSCTCGTCALEPINTCRCPFAAQMRGEVRGELDSLDVTSEASRQRAAQAVRASFVTRYGSKVVRRELDPNGCATGSVFGILMLLVVFLLVRHVRSRTRRSAHPPGSAEE